MAYTVNKTSGAVLTTIADGTIDTTTDLTLIGKNYAGYGEVLNEDLVKLLENFANTSAPSSPIAGQIWWDTSNSLLKVYTGTAFKTVSSSTSSATTPSNNVTGDLWWDTTNAQLKVYNGSSFTLIGPAFTSGSGQSGPIIDTVTDSVGSDHVVVKMFVSDTIVAILSKDSEFTPQSAIAGFATIKPGYNLSTTVSSAQWYGTASNADTLDSLNSTQFLRSDENDSTSGRLSILNDTGIVIGADSDLTIGVSGANVTIRNTTSDGDINFNINDGGTNKTVFLVDGASAAILPGSNNTHNIGASGNVFATVYATTFNGTSTQAQYADLAEIFETDDEYSVGTLVKIGGSKEATMVLEENSPYVLGVIAENPAYLMNSDGIGQAVALIGRVPVHVTGSVEKGDRLVSAGYGKAKKYVPLDNNPLYSMHPAFIGYALEDGENELIEAFIGK